MLHDQHMHSSYSRDSKEELRNYFIEADKQGIKYVLTCEHFDFCTTVDGTTWDVDYDKLIEEQKKLKVEFPNIMPLLGLELGYRKDYFDEMVDIASKYDFDLIQLSIHDSGVGDYYFVETFNEGIDKIMNQYFDLMEEGINSFNNYEVLSHIDFGFKTVVMIDPTYKFNHFEERLIKVFKLLIKNDKALEINSKVLETINKIYLENDSNYKYDDHLRYILKLYKSVGGKKLTLSSDAHTTSKYRLDFDKHIAVIKEMGFNELSYFIKRREYLYKI